MLALGHVYVMSTDGIYILICIECGISLVVKPIYISRNVHEVIHSCIFLLYGNCMRWMHLLSVYGIDFSPWFFVYFKPFIVENSWKAQFWIYPSTIVLPKMHWSSCYHRLAICCHMIATCYLHDCHVHVAGDSLYHVRYAWPRPMCFISSAVGALEKGKKTLKFHGCQEVKCIHFKSNRLNVTNCQK